MFSLFSDFFVFRTSGVSFSVMGGFCKLSCIYSIHVITLAHFSDLKRGSLVMDLEHLFSHPRTVHNDYLMSEVHHFNFFIRFSSL